MKYCLAVVFRIMSSHDSNRVPFTCVFRWGTAKNRRKPCRESREPVHSQECCVWPRKFESVARNELVRCHDAAATFRGHSPHGQIIGQIGMYRTSAYPSLLRKFSDCDTMILHDQIPHLVNELVISTC
jgi:hypothetical protein